jgi:predicted GTPase
VDRLGRRDVVRVRDACHAEVTKRPPTIGVVGTSGTGKSSTINTMFKTSLEISHTRPCTKEFLATLPGKI